MLGRGAEPPVVATMMRHDGCDKIMAQVLNCVSSHGLEEVLVAVELVIESGVLSAEHVLNVSARLNAGALHEAARKKPGLSAISLATIRRRLKNCLKTLAQSDVMYYGADQGVSKAHDPAN